MRPDRPVQYREAGVFVMARTDPNYFPGEYLQFHRDWYRDISDHAPTSEYLEVVLANLPANWSLRRSGLWYIVESNLTHLAEQGWKFHISARMQDAQDILAQVTRICVQYETIFKFAADPTLLLVLNSKGMARESAGKFITLYPNPEIELDELAEALHGGLSDYSGPYILSDRPYKESQTLYYRYGAYQRIAETEPDGEATYLVRDMEGALQEDLRTPYYSQPNWVIDPFIADAADDARQESQSRITLFDGRFEVEEALDFRASGGIYRGTDLDTGRTVVIKEARPNAGLEEAPLRDAVARLRRERDALSCLTGRFISPNFIEYFVESGHEFLVMEHIRGMELATFTVRYNPYGRADPSKVDTAGYYTTLLRIWRALLERLVAIHASGIAVGDLSMQNVIVANIVTGDLRIIDFEGARLAGDVTGSRIYTPGYRDLSKSREACFESDVYALAVAFFGTLLPISNLFELTHKKLGEITSSGILLTEFAVPGPMIEVVTGLIASSGGASDALAEAAARIDRAESEVISSTPRLVVCSESARLQIPVPGAEHLATSVKSAITYIEDSTNLKHVRCLIPADHRVHRTNGLGLAHGAAGLLHVLHKVNGSVAAECVGWLLERLPSAELPSGLLYGRAGIALSLLETGRLGVACGLIEQSYEQVKETDVSDVSSGLAGVGLVALRAYMSCGNAAWLEMASDIGTRLRDRAENVGTRGAAWPDHTGETYVGYPLGSTGIGLFLLYLGWTLGRDDFRALAELAIEHDLSYAIDGPDGELGMPRGITSDFDNAQTHYWLDGSAGVAAGLLRLVTYGSRDDLRPAVERLLKDTRRFTSFTGAFRGMAGLGDVQLDAAEILGEPEYGLWAREMATRILELGISRSAGLAFPGDDLLRISCDFATGGGGVALFLDRLVRPGIHRRGMGLLVDELFERPFGFAAASPEMALPNPR